MKAARSLRHHIVQVMAANQGRVLATEEIYERVAALGVASFDPRAKRDRNLVNHELIELAGRTKAFRFSSNFLLRQCAYCRPSPGYARSSNRRRNLSKGMRGSFPHVVVKASKNSC